MLSLIRKTQWSLYDITKGICTTMCFITHSKKKKHNEQKIWRMNFFNHLEVTDMLEISRAVRRHICIFFLTFCSVLPLCCLFTNVTCCYNCNVLTVEIIYVWEDICIMCTRRYMCAKMYNVDAFCGDKPNFRNSGANCTAEGGTQLVCKAPNLPQRADCFHLKSIEKLLKL